MRTKVSDNKSNATSAVNSIFRQVSRNDMVGSQSFFHPLRKRTKHIVLRVDCDLRGSNNVSKEIRPGPAEAVCHSGHHEQSKERLCVLPPPMTFSTRS